MNTFIKSLIYCVLISIYLLDQHLSWEIPKIKALLLYIIFPLALTILSIINLKSQEQKLSYATPFIITILALVSFNLLLIILNFCGITSNSTSIAHSVIESVAKSLPKIIGYSIIFLAYSFYPLLIASVTILILRNKKKNIQNSDLLDKL